MENLVPHKTNIFDVANNLINKLSAGVGWIFSRNTPEKKALETYINDIENSNFDPLTKAALITNAKKTIKEYCNQHDIVKYASEFISPSARVENVDNDWLNLFMDKARLVSDSEFQIIWGKILAGECDNPGSTPKILLNTLALMDKETAKKFMAIASVSVCIVEESQSYWHPIILKEEFGFFEKHGIKHDILWEIESLGLIKNNFNFGIEIELEIDGKGEIIYHDKKHTLPKNAQFDVGCITFTDAGSALCAAIQTNKIDGFFENICVPHIEKNIKSKAAQ